MGSATVAVPCFFVDRFRYGAGLASALQFEFEGGFPWRTWAYSVPISSPHNAKLRDLTFLATCPFLLFQTRPCIPQITITFFRASLKWRAPVLGRIVTLNFAPLYTSSTKPFEGTFSILLGKLLFVTSRSQVDPIFGPKAKDFRDGWASTHEL